MKHKVLAVLLSAVLCVGLFAGCGGKGTAGNTGETKENSENTSQEEGQTGVDPSVADQAVDEEEAEAAGFTDGEEGSGEKPETVVLNTEEPLSGKHHVELSIQDHGTLKIELDADSAPITVTNFIKLAQDDFYDGLTFHRIIDGFMMQGGDPLGNGTGGSSETIKGEFSDNGVDNGLSHTRGTISMARSSAPDSASSQFFIVQTDSTFLDGSYAAFGHVTDGMEIVDEICQAAGTQDRTIPAEEQPVIQDIVVID